MQREQRRGLGWLLWLFSAPDFRMVSLVLRILLPRRNTAPATARGRGRREGGSSRSSLATHPVRGAPLQMHDGKDPDRLGLDRVEHTVGEASNESAPDDARENPSRLGMIDDRIDACPDLVQKPGTETGAFRIVLLSRLVKLPLGQSGARTFKRLRHRSHKQSGYGTSNGQGERQRQNEAIEPETYNIRDRTLQRWLPAAWDGPHRPPFRPSRLRLPEATILAVGPRRRPDGDPARSARDGGGAQAGTRLSLGRRPGGRALRAGGSPGMAR